MEAKDSNQNKPFTDKLPRLKEENLVRMARVSASAFFDDPYTEYVFPSKEDRLKKCIYSEINWLKIGLKHGEVYTTSDNLEGVAIWFKPGYKVTLFDMLKNGLICTYLKYGIASSIRDNRVDEFAEKIKKKLKLPKHAYLGLLAVDPKHQGKGFASSLVKPVLEELDRTKTDCYLETTGEKNASMYEHFGFKTLEINTLPGTDLKLWAMYRKAGEGKG